MIKRRMTILIILFVIFLVLFTGFLIKSRESGSRGETDVPSKTADVPKVSDPAGQKADQTDGEDRPNPIEDTAVTDAPPVTATPVPTTPPPSPIVLAFAGDINLDEDSKPVARYDRENKGILGCFSPELVEEMNAADIFMLNNEFAYSTGGTEITEKSYTFRAHPKRVDILKEMGVDIVSLANNHALDFGMDALIDTFSTLDGAGIDYIGAGENMDRAKAPIYYTIGNTKIAYLAASRVVYAMDWYAGETSPGMIGTYDPTLFLSSIREAEENSDFVVVYVHWGVERTNDPVDYQKELARKYIDAGADAVIGCHPHVLQGLEFYNGKLIAYSLGNYWFNATKREAGLLKLVLNPDKSVLVQLLPTMGEDTYTYLITKEKERKAYYEFMEEISFGVTFDEEGYAMETE